MRFLPAILLILTLTAGCRREPSATSASSRGAADSSLTDYAWYLRDRGAPAAKFIAVQEEAVRQMRAGKSNDDPVAVLEQMALFYQVEGRYYEALDLYHEAFDSLNARPDRRNSEAGIQLYGDMSLFYGHLDMMPEAFAYSDTALAISKRLGGVMASDLYRFRSGFCQSQQDWREASRCLDLADNAVRTMKTNRDTSELLNETSRVRACLLLTAYPDRADSVKRAVTMLKAIGAGADDDPETSLYLGYGLALTGDAAGGIRLMEQSLPEIRESGDVDLTDFAYRRLMEILIANRRWDDVGRHYADARDANDTLQSSVRDIALINSKVRYDAMARERENEVLHTTLSLRKRQTWTLVIAFALLLMIIGYLAIMGIKRYRHVNYLRRLTRRRFDEARERTKIAEKAADDAMNRVKTLENDLSAKMNSNSEILSTPQLIVDEKQGTFRRAFSSLYPGFIASLKSDYPTLTPGDELLCMLIFLRHTTDEISIYLNISRASVNSARYRLRQKFELGKTDDLDDFLSQRPT